MLGKLRWGELADQVLSDKERGGKSEYTLTRQLREIDEDGRTEFPYMTAEQLLHRITVACGLRADFFAIDFDLPEDCVPIQSIEGRKTG